MTGIVYQFCTACGDRWVLLRPGCRSCGAREVENRISVGRGTVYSVTTQHRAPTRDFPVKPPWRIGLIDLAEGVRIMGHVDSDARIGDVVTGQMQEFGGTNVPVFDTRGKDDDG